MAATDPWITLGRGYDLCRRTVDLPDREVHLAWLDDTTRAGLVVLHLHGPFAGYIQAIAVAAESRGQGIGSALLDFAEQRVAQVSPNLFLCVSSFNPRAQALYARRGYALVGRMPDFVVEGHDELLLRKTSGPWSTFTPRPG